MCFTKDFSRQQANFYKHLIPLMYINKFHKPLLLSVFITAILFLNGCISIKTQDKRPTLLQTGNASQAELINQVNNLAKINSMYAKVDLKLEDNSYAELGIAEKYKSADGLVVVQRPSSIQLKVQIPVLKTDIVQMTSDGEKFRVALLEDGGSGKNKIFISGTNNADYAILQKEAINKIEDNGNGKQLKQNVNVFANIRPQHFTSAILVKPIDTEKNFYVQSTILQQEENVDVPKKSPIRNVLRGYYLLDEVRKNSDGTTTIMRRFWFDRVGIVRLARQQIFDEKGELESDIVYGQEGNLTESGEYKNLPLRIEVTRPKEKYKMRLTYQSPESVSIGKTYPQDAFILENRWNLPEVDLDKKVQEMTGQNPVNTKPVTEARSQ
jgi:outer membrane murein-binding lipoprotein Lpp